MADISVSNVLDGTTLNCELTLSFTNRTSNSVTVSYTAVTYLNASGHTSAGYEQYSGVISISGWGITAKDINIILKNKSEGWSGSARHTVSGSVTLYLTTTAAVYPSVSYTVRSSADSYNTVYGTCSYTCNAYVSPIPQNPATLSLSLSSVYYGQSLTLSWGSSSGAAGYKIYMSVHDGAWSLIATVSATSYSFEPTADFGSSIRFMVCAYNSSGASSGKVSGYVNAVGGMWLKRNGSYTPCNVYIRKAGSWRRVKCVYINKGGIWRVCK